MEHDRDKSIKMVSVPVRLFKLLIIHDEGEDIELACIPAKLLGQAWRSKWDEESEEENNE